ncbi:hypothetical protein COCOBI_pt-0510 (chloroplast) [Coccomyxa sp. Obi]|nr:hypothetical protein COCOBI_pt-0510 [Coccomyxa sp. Obi]
MRNSNFAPKKTVPSNIKKLLKNPISLAMWYLADSTLRTNVFEDNPFEDYACRFGIDKYSLEENRLLKS